MKEKNNKLIVMKKNPLYSIIVFLKKILKSREKNKGNNLNSKENNIENKQKKVYIVEYDTNPQNTKYGDIYLEDRIIRNSPYMKQIVNPINYSKKEYSKEEKKEILKKYNDLLNNKISINELNLDDIIIVNKLIKEEIKIRKKA